MNAGDLGDRAQQHDHDSSRAGRRRLTGWLAGRHPRGPHTDLLTGLAFREQLLRQGPRLLARAAAENRPAALLLLDLDGLKAVNDSAGHHVGDRVLAAVGDRLRGATDPEDLVVRLGGDEFAVLTGALTSVEAAPTRARALIEAIMAPLEVDDLLLAVGVSVGVALLDDDGDSIEELLRAADQAMYAAKASGTGQWRTTTPVGDGEPGLTRQLLAELSAGVPGDQIVVHYQPQVQLRTGTVVGFEALVRWDHPEHGLLPPARFVPLAERSGLMAPITAAVVEHALDDLPALQDVAPQARLSINLTRRHLLGRGLVDGLRTQVRRRGVSPRHVVIEVTEPLTHLSTETTETFGALSRHGFEVSIRGFGTARSSLTSLWANPAVREVKIDPSIVQGLRADGCHDDTETTRLVRALTGAARGLGIRVVAEGVEDAATAAALQRLDCDVLQGFWLCPPSPLDDVVGRRAEAIDNLAAEAG